MYYTSSKGDQVLVSDMENPHLIHAIAKYAVKVENGEGDADLLKAMKNEAIGRMAPREAQPAQDF